MRKVHFHISFVPKSPNLIFYFLYRFLSVLFHFVNYLHTFLYPSILVFPKNTSGLHCFWRVGDHSSECSSVCGVWFFSSCFQDFKLIFSNLIMMCLGVISFVFFTVFEFWLLWFCKLRPLTKFGGNFSHYFFKYIHKTHSFIWVSN